MKSQQTNFKMLVSQELFKIRRLSNDKNYLGLSLVIPTYNERENLELLVKVITDLLDSIIRGQYELIIVDDNSPDYTWKLAQKLTQKYPQLRVIRRIDERGLSTAVIRGWQIAQGDILGVIDGDLQHPPAILLKLWQEMNLGADLAVASRHIVGGGVSEWNLLRRLLSRGAQLLGLLILPEVVGRVSDPMSGYFMVRRRVLIERPLSPVGYKILVEVLAKGQICWISEIGYVFQERQEGLSKVSWKQYLEYIQHLLRLRFSLWHLGRFIRFGIVGFSGVFVDLIAFYIFRNFFNLDLSLSAIFSTELAIINNFIGNDSWTFKDISTQNKGLIKILTRLAKFNLICGTGLIINVLIVSSLVHLFNSNEYLAKLIAIALVTFWNFWLNLKVNWGVKEIHYSDK